MVRLLANVVPLPRGMFLFPVARQTAGPPLTTPSLPVVWKTDPHRTIIDPHIEVDPLEIGISVSRTLLSAILVTCTRFSLPTTRCSIPEAQLTSAAVSIRIDRTKSYPL